MTIVFALGSVSLLLFVASWVEFHSTGRFLDRDSLSFFLSNGVQLLRHFAHMEPYLAVAVPPVVLLCVLLLACVMTKLAHLSPSAHGRVAALSLTAALILSVGGLAGLLHYRQNRMPVVDPTVGTVYTVQELYTECRVNRTGPITHAIADIVEAALGGEERIEADPEIIVERRPIISMPEYLSRVDPRRLHRWNVIVVLVESLRTDQLRAGGSCREVMPSVEALAQSGRVYVKNYTQASHSNYADLCPLSSHYPLRSSRTHVYPTRPAYPRLPIYDILKAIGYRTAVISSQDENWGAMKNYLDTGTIEHFFHAGDYSGMTYVPYGDTGVEAWIKGTKRSGKIDDRYTASEAIRWTDSPGNEPFFIYMNLQNSHVPYETPIDFPRRFGPEKLPFILRFNSFPIRDIQLVKQVYANSLAYVDFQLGRLIEALKNRSQLDQTIIVVTGDNGQAFFEHGFAAHANKLFNEVMKVPTVIRAPGIRPGVDTRLAEHIDIPPTLLELLGLPPHPSFQGISLLKPDPSPRRSVRLVSQTPLAHQYAVVRNGMKLIYDAESNRYALFDLIGDPSEKHDLAVARPGMVQELRRQLDTWRKLQIEYYSSLEQQRKWYPPILKD